MANLQNSKVGNLYIGRTSSGISTARISSSSTGTGYRKTAIGSVSSNVNSGNDNTAFGFGALKSNSSCDNTAIGSKAMGGYGGNGNTNTAIGHCSMYNITSGTYNVAIGALALSGLTTGTCNVGIGHGVGPNLTTGQKNTFVGFSANIGGDYNDKQNVSIGYAAVASGSGGAYGNVAIGDGAQAIGSFSIAIGNASYVVNRIVWGGPSNNVYNCVWANWTYNSDCRDKTDIVDLNDNLGINLLRKLKPVSYQYDSRKLYVQKCNFDFGQKDGTLKVDGKSYGFLAQEIKTAAEELNINYEAVKYDPNRDTYSFGYSQLIATIVKTIKTIDERIQTLKTKI